MYPSVFRTSSTRARSFEPGVETLDLLRSCALRIRVIISPSGSLSDIARFSSPARLDETGYQPLGSQIAKRDSAQFELAVVAARTARHLTAIAKPGAR